MCGWDQCVCVWHSRVNLLIVAVAESVRDLELEGGKDVEKQN